jgi:hypothetical protein
LTPHRKQEVIAAIPGPDADAIKATGPWDIENRTFSQKDDHRGTGRVVLCSLVLRMHLAGVIIDDEGALRTRYFERRLVESPAPFEACMA